MKNLIMLVAMAAGALSAGQPELAVGDRVSDMPDNLADQLIAEGSAQLADAPVAKDPATPAPKGKLVKARVLVDGPHGKPNDVVTVPASVAKADPDLDADPAAVAYADSLAAAK